MSRARMEGGRHPGACRPAWDVGAECGSQEASSTNKADMSWLLNSVSEEKWATEAPAGDRAGMATKRARAPDSPVEASAGRHPVQHDGLRDAPMLYHLAAHAGIAASGSDGSTESTTSSSAAGGEFGPLKTGRVLTSRLAADKRGETGPGPAKTPRSGTPSETDQTRSTTLSRSTSRETLASASSADSPEPAGETDCSGGDLRRKSWSVSLDEALAIQIYASRPRNAGSKYGSMAEAVRLGERHGVSPKTIRDIWNRKSWVKVTRAYWTPAEASAYVPRRHRPTSPRENARGGSPKRRVKGGGQGKAG
jgi:hypothetical protein